MNATGDTTELTMIRVFDAPRTLVWEVWTNPAHAAKWWGPRGFSTPVFEADLRPGGAFLIDMLEPDGTIYRNPGTYEEVIPPERLVHVSSVELAGTKLLDARTTVTFEEFEGKTKVTVHQLYLNVATGGEQARDGAHEGWKQHLDCLGEYLEGLAL